MKPFKFLNISDSGFEDVHFSDLRNYVAHPKDSNSKLQLKVNKAFINQLINVITDSAPYVLPILSKI